MKFAGARGITRTRVPLIAMLALAATIGLAGCEGDDGKDGAADQQVDGEGQGARHQPGGSQMQIDTFRRFDLVASIQGELVERKACA